MASITSKESQFMNACFEGGYSERRDIFLTQIRLVPLLNLLLEVEHHQR
jgi:hypothetical protein